MKGRSYPRAFPVLWTAPARRGGGVRRDPEPPAGEAIRNTRPLTYPLRITLHHKQGRTVEQPLFRHLVPQGTLLQAYWLALDGAKPENDPENDTDKVDQPERRNSATGN